MFSRRSAFMEATIPSGAAVLRPRILSGKTARAAFAEPCAPFAFAGGRADHPPRMRPTPRRPARVSGKSRARIPGGKRKRFRPSCLPPAPPPRGFPADPVAGLRGGRPGVQLFGSIYDYLHFPDFAPLPSVPAGLKLLFRARNRYIMGRKGTAAESAHSPTIDDKRGPWRSMRCMDPGGFG
jgi:hypothetical protein